MTTISGTLRLDFENEIEYEIVFQTNDVFRALAFYDGFMLVDWVAHGM